MVVSYTIRVLVTELNWSRHPWSWFKSISSLWKSQTLEFIWNMQESRSQLCWGNGNNMQCFKPETSPQEAKKHIHNIAVISTFSGFTEKRKIIKYVDAFVVFSCSCWNWSILVSKPGQKCKHCIHRLYAFMWLLPGMLTQQPYGWGSFIGLTGSSSHMRLACTGRKDQGRRI